MLTAGNGGLDVPRGGHDNVYCGLGRALPRSDVSVRSHGCVARTLYIGMPSTSLRVRLVWFPKYKKILKFEKQSREIR